MDKIFFDTAILIGGHALILGHKPVKLSLGQIQKKVEEEKMDFASLGLFDRASPNYTTYYPDVTEEDLTPTPDQFIEPVFRMLSEVTVHKKYNPINFPASVLKKTMYKLIGQTVNVDHEMAVGNAVGSIKAVEWQNAYSINGIKVPAGINATLLIDGKANPRLARGIMMDPPSIHSNSVTVNFAWKKSHPKLEDNEFYSKLGTYGKDGKLVQRIVTDIAAYHETSLVSHGADPFAQKVVDGKIVNPGYAGSQYWTEDTANKVKEITNSAFNWDWKDCESFSEQEEMITINMSGTTIPDAINNNNDQNIETMDAYLRFLETQFKLEKDSLTEENYQAKLAEYKTAQDAILAEAQKEPDPIKIGDFEGVEAITAEVARLQAVEATVPADLKDQLDMAAHGKVVTEELRVETKRLYGLTVKAGEEDATILALIVGADYNTLKSLHKQYDKQTEGEFTFTCTACGSHDVTRASANPAEEGKGEVTNKSSQSVIEKFTSIEGRKLPNTLQQPAAKK